MRIQKQLIARKNHFPHLKSSGVLYAWHIRFFLLRSVHVATGLQPRSTGQSLMVRKAAMCENTQTCTNTRAHTRARAPAILWMVRPLAALAAKHIRTRTICNKRNQIWATTATTMPALPNRQQFTQTPAKPFWWMKQQTRASKKCEKKKPSS